MTEFSFLVNYPFNEFNSLLFSIGAIYLTLKTEISKVVHFTCALYLKFCNVFGTFKQVSMHCCCVEKTDSDIYLKKKILFCFFCIRK